jgi:predicted negative regulator of RcsB-dependent stress response
VDETLSEKEQIEEIRAWWKENGNYVIAGLVLGIGGIFGFNQWKSANLQTQLEASALYESLVNEVADDRPDPAELIAADIYANYPETVYADEARLAMARLFMDQGRDEDAAAELRALVSSGGFNELQMVGRLRLAKILLYQGKAEEVLTLLEGHTDSAFAPRFDEIIGDAHFALGNFEMAQVAYLQALSEPAASQVLDTNLVQMKINDLPENLPAGEGPVEQSVLVPAGDAAESGDATDVVTSDAAENEETP